MSHRTCVRSRENILTPPLLIRFQTDDGGELGIMQYIPWLDSGVIKWSGKIPLEGVLALVAPPSALAHKIKWNQSEFTTICSITQAEFTQWPDKFNQKMTGVRAFLVKWKMGQVFDEGTREPFIARLFVGLLGIRDKVFSSQKSREEFDKAYEPVLQLMMAARTAQRHIRESVQPSSSPEYMVGSTDEERAENRSKLAAETGELIRSLLTVMKGMISVFTVFGLEITFLFDTDSAFRLRLDQLSRDRPALAEYIGRARQWFIRLLELDQVRIEGQSIIVGAEKMSIDGLPVSDFADMLFGRVASFVENTCIYLFKSGLPPSLVIREIPIAERRPETSQAF